MISCMISSTLITFHGRTEVGKGENSFFLKVKSIKVGNWSSVKCFTFTFTVLTANERPPALLDIFHCHFHLKVTAVRGCCTCSLSKRIQSVRVVKGQEAAGMMWVVGVGID